MTIAILKSEKSDTRETGEKFFKNKIQPQPSDIAGCVLINAMLLIAGSPSVIDAEHVGNHQRYGRHNISKCLTKTGGDNGGQPSFARFASTTATGLPYQRGRTTRRNTRKRGLPRVGLRLRDRLAFVVVFVSVGVRSSGSISDPLAHSLGHPLHLPPAPLPPPRAVRKSKSPQTKGHPRAHAALAWISGPIARL